MVKTSSNLNLKCRACLSEGQEMHHLFSEFDQGLNLSDILCSTAYLEIEETDELSSYLCENCTTVVVEFFNFKAIFLENNNNITSVFNDQNLEQSEYLKKPQNFEIRCSTKPEECYENTVKNEKLDHIQIIPSNSTETQYDDIEKLNFKRGSVDSKVILNDTLEDSNLAENVDILQYVKYCCEECGNCFSLKSSFQQHLIKKHNLSVYDLDKYVSNRMNQVSEQIKDENIILQCDTCNENFKTCAEIEDHYKSHKKYVCEHCGAGFLKKSYLNDHAEIHTVEKRHVCPICGKAFRRRTVLVKHKKIHTHPRQCICEICGLRFTDKGTLKTHIKLKHTKERNFNCTICGLWFPLKSTLMKHIYRHNDDRKREHVCALCHMAYKDKSSLNRHVIIKHTENITKPSCSLCGKRYTTNTNLLKHIRKHHRPLHLKEEVVNL